jgi:hypothetical protein
MASKCFEHYLLIFSLKYSTLLRVIILSTTDSICQSITSILYIMINFIWLHVSTFKKSSSGHLNLLPMTNSQYI